MTTHAPPSNPRLRAAVESEAMDWIHSSRPPYGVPVQIFDRLGKVRRGVSEGYYFRLMDCTQPWQNCAYTEYDIVAWRPEAEAVALRQVKERR